MMRSIHDLSVLIDYTNHRGERSLRRVVPERFLHGCLLPGHPGQGWAVVAYDLDRKESLSFALRGVHGWYEPEPVGENHYPAAGADTPGPVMGPASWAALVTALLSLAYAAARGPCPRAGLASLGAGVLLVTAGAALWPGRS